MRALDAGEFHRDPQRLPVGALTPTRRRRFVERDAALAAFRTAAPIDSETLPYQVAIAAITLAELARGVAVAVGHRVVDVGVLPCGVTCAILVVMGTRVRDFMMGSLGQLRYEPVEKRIRGVIDDQVIIDTVRALVVWEPKRVVPSYAIPVEELDRYTSPAADVAADEPTPDAAIPHLGDRPVYDPSVPFVVHTADGAVLDLCVGGIERPAAAFRPADDVLSKYVILDFDAFDQWLEEDERNVGHPRDPFHRVEIVHSSRSVRIERDGELLASSSRPYLLLEAPLPVRFYLPPEDVSDGVLHASSTRTLCAYKGQATYWSLENEDDIAWSYPAPLREAAEVTDRIAFFDERVDLTVDGVSRVRPVTPWSRR